MRIKKHPRDRVVKNIRVLEFFSDKRQEPYRYEFRNVIGELAVMTYSEQTQDWFAVTCINGSKKSFQRNDDPEKLIEAVLEYLSAK